LTFSSPNPICLTNGGRSDALSTKFLRPLEVKKFVCEPALSYHVFMIFVLGSLLIFNFLNVSQSHSPIFYIWGHSSCPQRLAS